MPALNRLRINGVDYDISGGGGGGSVTGVKGNKESSYRTGNVNLTPANIGALPDTTDIPTKTSDLTNDSEFITGLTILTYGSSTWNDFIMSFNANKVVFVRCGAGTTPGASTKPILAHLVKVDYYNGNPRYAEFRFDDYIDQKTYADQDDHIRIYKLFTDNGWTLTTVPVAPRIVAGDGINYDWTTSGRERSLTLSLDNTLNNLTNYYTKSNTYTKTEVDNLIGAISTISFEIVQTLPTTNIKTNVIYLVPKSTAQTNNTYDEYINTTGTSAGWEKIGDTAIDLNDYYSITDNSDTTIDEYDDIPFYDASLGQKKKISLIDFMAKLKTYFDTLYATISALNNKVDKVSGKGLSTNDYTTADKNKVDALKDLAYIAKDGSSTKYLKGDGTWDTFPTIPTVNNGKLTIQKNGTTLETFFANQSNDDTVNITVPTTASDVNAVKYDGDLTSLGSGANATPTKAYFDNYVNNNKVEIAFDSMTPDYTIIFGRGASNTDNGNILKYGITDKYLRILRKIGGNWQSEDWEKISAGYADTAGSASSATSANQLATARNINLGSDFTGSASFNGSSDITINGNFYYANCDSGNTANYPWHRIAKVEGQTGQYVDKEVLLLIRGRFNGGTLGLIKIALRTNSTNTACAVSAKWLYRYGISETDVVIAQWGVTGQSVYADVFLKRGQWARTYVYQVAGNRSFTLVASGEADNTTASDKKTSYEVYKTVASAGTEIHSQAYTSTVEAEDGGNVAYAKNAGTVNGKTVEENVPSGAKFTDTTYNFSGNTFYSGDQNNSEHNANNAIKNGHYYYTSNGPTTSIGASGNDGALYVQQYSDSWVAQIAQDYRNGNLFVRGKNNGTWQSWKKIANSADIPTALSQLTSDSNHRTVTDAQIATFSGNAQWGGITGNIANQGDLQNELDLKLDKTGGNVGPLTVENEWSSGEIESATYQSDGIRLHYSGNAFQSAYTVWLGGEVLWTNPSLTADFAQQTITLARELSHYEYYEVVAKRAKGNPQFLSTGLIPVKDASDGGITSRIYNSAECNYMRQFNTEHSTGTSFKISTCGKFATYGSTNQTTANSYIIPWQVIGFRFICGV